MDRPLEARLVLLVEDDDLVARLATALLEDLGASVHHANDGHAALRACRRQRPDVVLLDLGLPDLDGTAVTRAIRAMDGAIATVPIVWTTGAGQVPADAGQGRSGMEQTPGGAEQTPGGAAMKPGGVTEHANPHVQGICLKPYDADMLRDALTAALADPER